MKKKRNGQPYNDAKHKVLLWIDGDLKNAKGKPLRWVCIKCLKLGLVFTSASETIGNVWSQHFVGNQGARACKVQPCHAKYAAENISLTHSRVHTVAHGGPGGCGIIITRMTASATHTANCRVARLCEKQYLSFRAAAGTEFKALCYHLSRGAYDGASTSGAIRKIVKADAHDVAADIKGLLGGCAEASECASISVDGTMKPCG